MQIKLNNQIFEIEEGTTIKALLEKTEFENACINPLFHKCSG